MIFSHVLYQLSYLGIRLLSAASLYLSDLLSVKRRGAATELGGKSMHVLFRPSPGSLSAGNFRISTGPPRWVRGRFPCSSCFPEFGCLTCGHTTTRGPAQALRRDAKRRRRLQTVLSERQVEML